ncbi:MAG: DNA repair protein RecO [Dehalococcoidia bacterium]|nr:DNA repair protein RecO [Dehalococcoidia bacterium]
MSNQRTYQTQAIIIKKTKLGEADRILTLYSPTMGKIQGFAKAVRKPKSKLGGHLEMLTYSQVTLVRGKNIDTIIGSQTLDAFLMVKNDLDLLSCALYMTEMISQFTPAETEDIHLFELLLHSIEQLPLVADRNLLLRYFELRLLGQVGYRPELGKCVLCSNKLETSINSFSPSAGGVLCRSCHRLGKHYGNAISWDGLEVMRFIQGGDWESISITPIDATILDEIERMLRSYMRHLLEREIKSIVWLDSIKRDHGKPTQLKAYTAGIQVQYVNQAYITPALNS